MYVYFYDYIYMYIYINIYPKTDKDIIHICRLVAYHPVTCHGWQWNNYLQIYYKCGNIGLWKRCSNLQEKKTKKNKLQQYKLMLT